MYSGLRFGDVETGQPVFTSLDEYYRGNDAVLNYTSVAGNAQLILKIR